MHVKRWNLLEVLSLWMMWCESFLSACESGVFKGQTVLAFAGEEPFRMAKAAHYLERLARNELERGDPLEINNCLPAPGPSMGRGFLAHDDVGVSFDPVSQSDLHTA